MVLYCYHGTNGENSKSILKDGFREGTYFAYHLEDALTFGGQYVFLVEFDETKFNNTDDENDRWQFWIINPIAPDKIKSLTNYNPEILYAPAGVSGLESSKLDGKV